MKNARPLFELKCGANRWTFLAGRLAFKVPNLSSWRLFLFGLLNNMNERWAASVSPGETHCPIRGYVPGGFLNIMPRCDPLTDAEWRDFDLASIAGYEVEHKIDSFGVFAGRVVVVDYGIPREKW